MRKHDRLKQIYSYLKLGLDTSISRPYDESLGVMRYNHQKKYYTNAFKKFELTLDSKTTDSVILEVYSFKEKKVVKFITIKVNRDIVTIKGLESGKWGKTINLFKKENEQTILYPVLDELISSIV